MTQRLIAELVAVEARQAFRRIAVAGLLLFGGYFTWLAMAWVAT